MQPRCKIKKLRKKILLEKYSLKEAILEMLDILEEMEVMK